MALLLNGTNQYAEIRSTIVTLSNSTQWSYCFWFKPQLQYQVDDIGFVGGSCSDGTGISTFYERSAGPSLIFNQPIRKVDFRLYNGFEQFAATDISAYGGWIFAAVVSTGTGQYGINYYNNSATGQVPFGLDPVSDGHDRYRFGASVGTNLVFNYFAGKIAHFAVFNVQLTNTQIQKMLDGARPDSSTIGNTPSYYRPLISGTSGGIGATSVTLINSPTFDSDEPRVGIKFHSNSSIQSTRIFEGQTFGANARFTSNGSILTSNILIETTEISQPIKLYANGALQAYQFIES